MLSDAHSRYFLENVSKQILDVAALAMLCCNAHFPLDSFRAKSSSRASMLSVEKLGELDEVHFFVSSAVGAVGAELGLYPPKN